MKKNLLTFILVWMITWFLSWGVYAESIQLKERPLPERYNECQHCHLKKQKSFIPSSKKTVREHTDKGLKHGNIDMSCNHCHDVGNRNFLRSTSSHKASFQNSSPVCAQCHEDRYREWNKGIHGHRIGTWKADKIQFHCIDCHDAHDVTFKKMQSRPPPKKPQCCGEEGRK